jgi:hypothetical protein
MIKPLCLLCETLCNNYIELSYIAKDHKAVTMEHKEL